MAVITGSVDQWEVTLYSGASEVQIQVEVRAHAYVDLADIRPDVDITAKLAYFDCHVTDVGARVVEARDVGGLYRPRLGRDVEKSIDLSGLDAADTDVLLRLGDRGNDLGEVAVHHAAGTNGGASVARAYFEHGVDTVLYIHVGAGDTDELREEFAGEAKNLVVTGHIASDAIGMNAVIDALEERGVECDTISGCGIGREE